VETDDRQVAAPDNVTAIYGFIYDCATGRINEVKEASAAGKAA
jgi:hypothetical protein